MAKAKKAKEPEKAREPRVTFLSWDHRNKPNLKTPLKPLGVQVYLDPAFNGSDSFGYVFADRPLPAAELRRRSEDYNEMSL